MSKKTNGEKFTTPVHFDFSPADGHGLTKREYFAVLAMQGLLASETENWNSTTSDVAKSAVEHADALLAALAQSDD